jgi:hypothetical protein
MEIDGQAQRQRWPRGKTAKMLISAGIGGRIENANHLRVPFGAACMTGATLGMLGILA